MMTREQRMVLARCRSMIKKAFPSMTGKFIFRLDGMKLGDKGSCVDLFMPSLRLDADLRSEEVKTVDIQM